MPSAAYGIGAFRRTAGRLPEIKVKGFFVESSGGDPDDPVVLIAWPGLADYQTVGSGAVRGLLRKDGVFGGDLFAVIGQGLYREGVLLGTVPGTGIVSMAASDIELLIANGSGLYKTNGSTVAAVTFPDSAGVTSVGFINNQFVASRANSPRFYWSAVGDGNTWDALDYATAERAPDDLQAVWVVGDELWLVGEESVEFWQPTGDLDLPYERVPGRYYNRGCRSRATIRDIAGTIMFVGDDGKVYAGAGDNEPTPVSTNSIEERISNTVADDLSAFVFTWQGHRFYVLKTAQGSFGYDIDTRQWCERGSYGRDNFRGQVACQIGDRVLIGDDGLSTIWEFDDSVFLDGTDPIQGEWSASIPAEGKPFHLHNLHLDVAVGQSADLSGQGANPIVERRFSRDGGNTWSGWKGRKLGAQGQYRARPTWLGEGLVDEPGRVIEFRISDPVPRRVSGVRFNDLGGSMARTG